MLRFNWIYSLIMCRFNYKIVQLMEYLVSIKINVHHIIIKLHVLGEQMDYVNGKNQVIKITIKDPAELKKMFRYC